jgi:lipoyl synthase
MRKVSPYRAPDVDRDLFDEAWNLSRRHHGDQVTFYLPGMIRYGNLRGLYPALSLTGDGCELLCEHCKGLLLKPMIQVSGPEALVAKCRNLARSGRVGVLLSGGSDSKGRLPWERFYEAISEVKSETGLFISVHSGFLDLATAAGLKQAGVDQALIDIMGDEETARDIYHLDGLHTVIDSLENLVSAGIEVVPHIVAGLMYGRMQGEHEALRTIARFRPASLVIVALTPLKGTPMSGVSPPLPAEMGNLIATARLMMPFVPISLGCERPRTGNGQVMEELAIQAGATRMALWSEKTVDLAVSLGLRPRFQPTCCSVPYREEFSARLPISI